jgi:hypothetical protein
MNTDKTSIGNESQLSCLGAVINPIKIYVKVKKCSTMHNENGYVNYFLTWAFIRKRGSIIMFTKNIVNGDVGNECQS